MRFFLDIDLDSLGTEATEEMFQEWHEFAREYLGSHYPGTKVLKYQGPWPLAATDEEWELVNEVWQAYINE